MQIYGPKAGLERFRREAVHCQAMCEAIAAEPDEPKAAEFAALATHAQGRIDTIDARMGDLRRAGDILTRAAALERVRKIRTKEAYEQLRRDLAAEAAATFRTLLPTAPNTIGKAGIKRALGLVEGAVANLRGPDFPESVRTEHLPILERQFQRMREADLAEDQSAASLSALRAGIILFKANQQRERESAYGRLVELVGKVGAEEFFLPLYTRKKGSAGSEDVEDDEDLDDVG